MKCTASALRATLALLFLAAPAAAQLPFVPFGARAAAMGDAAVALSEGAASAMENPAAAPEGRLGAALSAGLAGAENGDFLSPLEIVSGNARAVLAGGAPNLGEVAGALRTLAQTGNGVLGDGRAGVVVASRGWALSLTEYGWGASFVRADLTHLAAGTDPATSVLFNRSAAVYRSLRLDDLALTNSRSFASGAIRVGVTLHALRGTTASKEEDAFSTEVGDALQLARRTTTGVERTRTRFSWDAGLLVKVGVLEAGAVVRAVNRPEFPFDEETAPAADRGTSVTYGRQARIGAAVHVPVVGLTLAADLDLGANETLIPALSQRELGGGAELKIGPIAVRGGVAVNLDGPDRTKRFTGGVGLGLGPVKADVAAVYRPDRSQLGAVLTARVGL